MSLRASPPRIAILGGGLTGLTAAWRLQREGFAVVVFEKSPRTGGVVSAHREDGWLHELGPNSLLEGPPEVAAAIDELGLGPRRLYAAPAAKNRYICHRGELVAASTGPLAFATTRLFSLRAKLALLGEPWRPAAPGDAEESVADFAVRRLGQEFLDYAVNPFVGGIYAGDPRRLAVRHAFPQLHALEQEHGSLLRGAFRRRGKSGGGRRRIFSFPDGLEEIPRALTAALGAAVRRETTVRTVRRLASGWEIATETAGASAVEPFAAVLCALPADALAALKIDGVPAAREVAALREIEHPPVASVFTGFRRSDVAHALDGFGVLVPEVERRTILGTLFSSTLFPGRAPDGHVALTTFVGGTRQPELATRDDRELLRGVTTELADLLGTRGAPAFTHIQRWPRAIPQYAQGYGRFKALMAAVEADAPGFFIGGNSRDGISLANCIASGIRLAGAAASFVGAAGKKPAA